MKPCPWIALCVSAVAGALVWAFSPILADHKEAWDASGHYYLIALVLAGFVSGVIAPRPTWVLYLGAVLGQAVYLLLFLTWGPLLPVGIALLFVYSLVFWGAAALARLLRKLFHDQHGSGASSP